MRTATAATATPALRSTRGRGVRIAAIGAATASALMVTLTACGGDGSGTKTDGRADISSTAPAADTSETGTGVDAGARTGGAGQSADEGSGGSSGGDDATGTGGSGTGAHRAGACGLSGAELSVKTVRRPVNHLLLEFTNRSAATCDLRDFPFLRFGRAQSATPASGSTKPQAVVTLAPGETGYAGIRTSSAGGPSRTESGGGSGAEGFRTTTLTVSLSRSGRAATVDLPGEVHTDSSAEVTYWQAGADDALAW